MLLICQSGINVGKFSEKSSQDFCPYYYGKKLLIAKIKFLEKSF